MERVYVGNLPPDVRIKDIDDFFRPFGKLVSINVNSRSNPAFAYVQFDNERNAINAVRARCGYDYEGYTLQVKLCENANDRGFEVRNQKRQVPPPPPPMFNDYNDQRYSRGIGNNFGNNDFHNNNQGGYGNIDYGNNNFGNNFVPDNTNNPMNTNFMNPSSLFQSNMTPQNMQYPNNTMSPQNNMIEYSTSSRWSANFNIGDSANRSGGGFDRNSGSFDRNSGSFDRNSGSFDCNSGSFDHNGCGFNGNVGGFDRNVGSFDRSGGSYGRSDDGFDRSGGSFNRNNGGSNHGIGVSYRERPDNDNRYNDDKYEDSYTQGLSGSGRKWFNRYIRKGFSAKIAREKALEHRTVPYLRGGTNFDDIPSNHVANLPLPALENIGNKLISLFGNGGVDNNGGNGNQMASNFSNWGGDNFQGDFSNNNRQNEFNMSGRSSSNYDERSSIPRRARNISNRDGRPAAIKEKGVLEKMLEEIPTFNQRKIVARQHYAKSLSILKRLEAKKDKDFRDRKSRQHHKKIVQEYEDLYKNPQAIRNVKSEPGRGGQMSKISSFRKGAELKMEYQRKKNQLYEEARRLPDFPRGILTESARGKVRQLIRQGFEQNGAKVLARLPLTKIKKFIDAKIEYENAMKNLIRGSSNKTTATTTTTTKAAATAKAVAPQTVATLITKPRSDKDAAYYNNVKLLKKYEESKTINDNIKRLLLTCLKKVRQYEELMKLPKTPSKFENLLPKVVKVANKPIAKKVENKVEPTKDTKKETPPTASKENVVNDDKPPEDTKNNEVAKKNANACANENVDETVDLTEEKSELTVNDQDEEEITADQNDDEDNAEFPQDENDMEDNVEFAEDPNDNEDNVEFIEDQNEDEDQNDHEDNVEFTEDQNDCEDNVEFIEDQNDENDIDLPEEQEEDHENEDEN